MLYSMFDWLRDLDVPGARLMDYITFRSGVAFVLALFIATVFGRRIIDRLQRMQIGEVVRDLGLQGQLEKKGTPTMGGATYTLAILVPCLLVGNLANVYMQLMIVATLWLGTLGFLDDYLKLKRHNKDGMKGKFKIVGQVGLGLLVGLTVWLSPRITMVPQTSETYVTEAAAAVSGDDETSADANANASSAAIKTPQTTIPLVKNNNFDYQSLTEWMGDFAPTGGWIAFVLVTIFVVAATSNGANLTDGLDGLCAGTSAIIGVGDTGSLTIGGIIAVFAILIRKELLIPILCAIFFIEDLSVIIQTTYFRLTKGGRVFKMTPLHHHFQKPGDGSIRALIQSPRMAIPESKIVTRFWIIGILLAAITFVTLKIR